MSAWKGSLTTRQNEKGSFRTTGKLPHSANILAGLDAREISATELAEAQCFVHALERAVGRWLHHRKRRQEGPFLAREIAR